MGGNFDDVAKHREEAAVDRTLTLLDGFFHNKRLPFRACVERPELRRSPSLSVVGSTTHDVMVRSVWSLELYVVYY